MRGSWFLEPLTCPERAALLNKPEIFDTYLFHCRLKIQDLHFYEPERPKGGATGGDLV